MRCESRNMKKSICLVKPNAKILAMSTEVFVCSYALAEYRTIDGTERCATIAGVRQCEIGRMSGFRVDFQFSQIAESVSGVRFG